jgi:ABC-type uncharacterized transport system substrate-binding protein
MKRRFVAPAERRSLRRLDGWSKIAVVLRSIRMTALALLLAIVPAAVAQAQPPSKLPTIGILATGQARTAPPYPALERALRDLGLVDGQNVRIEFRMAEGHIERLPALAAELVRSNVDVIVAGGTFPSLEAARSASSVVPIVMIAVDYDPLAAKVVPRLNRPGGNITGVFVRQIELTAKRMELLKEIVPKARRIAILSDDFTVNQLKMAESTAMFPLPEFADAGGLIAYGANLDVTFASAAPYIDKILKGVKPADLPIEQPKSFELVVNMKSAKAMGLTIPPSVLLRADRVIE